MKKVIIIASIVIVAALSLFVYFRYYWTFADGYKEGQLNNIMLKGYLFKTYEGKLIQSGYKGGGSGVQSNEFEFSATESAGKYLEPLEDVSSKNIKLHYKEYNNPLPWRGFSKFVVDSVIILGTTPNGGTQKVDKTEEQPPVL